jgi:hypothetical protein
MQITNEHLTARGPAGEGAHTRTCGGAGVGAPLRMRHRHDGLCPQTRLILSLLAVLPKKWFTFARLRCKLLGYRVDALFNRW